MSNLNRRDFIVRTAGAIAAAWGGSRLAMAEARAGENILLATSKRVLGKTGIETTLLGMGTGVKAGGGQSALTRKGRESALEVITHAYEQGIRYFDMAESYGAHALLREAMKGPIDRGKVMLLTKTSSRKPDEVKADIEQYRTELDTDQIDVVLLHCMTQPDWTTTLEPCMDVLADAKARGRLRAHGISCHKLEALQAAAESPWVDVVLVRINPYGLKMDGPPEDVVPVMRKAREAGKSVLGMKIVGEGQCSDRLGESIKWVLTQNLVDAMAIGFLAPPEIESAMNHVRQAAATT